MRGRKLISGVNLQEALNKEGVKQGFGLYEK
jgi:hypothetical protein